MFKLLPQFPPSFLISAGHRSSIQRTHDDYHCQQKEGSPNQIETSGGVQVYEPLVGRLQWALMALHRPGFGMPIVLVRPAALKVDQFGGDTRGQGFAVL